MYYQNKIQMDKHPHHKIPLTNLKRISSIIRKNVVEILVCILGSIINPLASRICLINLNPNLIFLPNFKTESKFLLNKV